MNPIEIPTPQGHIFGMSAGSADGRPFALCLHGRSQRNGWHSWQPVMKPLAEAGWRVVSVDMPGWGQSNPWEQFEPVEAVMAVLDGLGVETAVLCGKSWGGGVALETALRHSARVSHVVLTAPVFRGEMAELERLTQPMLMAWAQDDEVFPVSFTGLYTAVLPHLQLVVYPTGGHSAAMNNAAEFVPKMVELVGN